MTNPAVAKWLEEIALAKAKAQAKAPQASTPNINAQDNGLKLTSSETSSNNLPKEATTTTVSASPYGIFPSFNLKTRKKQIRLVLPPPPSKPGPGECCGNDCNPCINTLYQEDLANYQERVRNLKAEYEQASLDLEHGRPQDGTLSIHSSSSPAKASTLVLGDEDQEAGLSLRSYRPFKILRKDYLNENTLLVVCDVPMPSPWKKPTDAILSATNTEDQGDDSLKSMFHVLIRFKSGPERDDYLTKAFTPVDISSLQDGDDRRNEDTKGKLAFLIKIYPTPHLTSDMFRRLQVGLGDNDRGVLYLRGPIHTTRTPCKDAAFVDEIPSVDTTREPRAWNHRIVMIAAGSGITPMYQLLQHLHRDEMQASGQEGSSQEVDLIYCNRTKKDIWLRQELQQLETSANQEVSENKVESWRRRTIRIQHVLSSSLVDRPTLKPVREMESEEGRFHSGRITLGLLRDTLQHSLQKDSVEAEDHILRILICGPPSFNSDVSRMLLQLGYSSSPSSSMKNRCEIHILE